MNEYLSGGHLLESSVEVLLGYFWFGFVVLCVFTLTISLQVSSNFNFQHNGALFVTQQTTTNNCY